MNPNATIYHAVERHLVSDPNEIQRRKKVLASWEVLYAGGVVPCHYGEGEYKRSARGIGDKRNLPYLKDVLAFALERAQGPGEIICWTNDDIVLHRELPRALRRHVAIWDCCSSHRCEFHYRKMPSMEAPPAMFGVYRENHIGRDLFAFSVGWLRQYWEEIPDFILGASDFDLCLAWILRLKKGFATTEHNLADVVAPCELMPGLCLHDWHRAAWTEAGNVMSAPSQLHNRRLFMEWTRKRGITLTWDWAREWAQGRPGDKEKGRPG